MDMWKSASLNGFARVAAELGLDPLALVGEFGLPPACLAEPDLKIPSIKVLQLFDIAASRSGAADFGLRVARLRQFSNLGPIAMIVREQPDVRRAVDALAATIWSQTEGLTISRNEHDGIAVLAVSLAHTPATPVRQNVELALAVLVGILRRFLGTHWVPEMVLFSHRKPATIALHVTTFGRAPLFDQEVDAIVVRATDLDTVIPEADPAAATQLIRFLEFVAGRNNADLVEKVQHHIHSLLPLGDCRAGHVAQQLGIDRRTLHRRLAQRGTSFSALVQRERIELAQAYAGDRSLTEIAGLLGFSCLSAFSRWRRQTQIAR